MSSLNRGLVDNEKLSKPGLIWYNQTLRLEATVRKYDLTIILNPNLEPERLSQEEKAVEQIMAAHAEVLGIQRLGQRTLAYPVNKVNQGYYLYFNLNSEPQALLALEAELRLRDNVLRVMTTRETVLA